MDIIQLMPRLYFIRLPVGHAYLWQDPDGLTLIDTGLPGSAPLIAEAIRKPLTHDAAAALQAAAQSLPADTGRHARDTPGNRR